MTISKILNSCCDYSPIENPIKNAIHTWYLPSGCKTHLIRHDDKIEFLTINGKVKTSVFSNLEDIPKNFSSPEEFIEFMIEMDPIFDANGELKFTVTEKLHIWERKYENPIELVSAVDELYLKTISDKTTVLRKFPASDGLSLEEQISWAKERYPHAYGHKDNCEFAFEEKIKERKSAIDKNIPIDMDHWCVTMFNADTSNIWDACLPCNWMGHALLVVETLEEGNYFARQIDLIKNREGKARVRLFELPQLEIKIYVKGYAKSETHRRPKEDIQRMIDSVYKGTCNQKAGNPNVIFALDSGKVLESLARLSHRGEGLPLTNLVKQRTRMNRMILLEEQYRDFYNCIQYGTSKLALAKIKDSLTPKYVLSKAFWPTPVLYTESKLSKLKALVQETSLIASYSALIATVPAFLGFLFAGPIGASFGLGAGISLGLNDVSSAYKISQAQEKKSEIKKEEKT